MTPFRLSLNALDDLKRIATYSSGSWLAMQAEYDLWHAERNLELGNVHRIKLNAA